MKNKGFTLVEFILVIAIIGILASSVLFFLTKAQNKKAEVEKTVSTQASKFDRVASFAKDTGQPALGAIEDLGVEPTKEQECGSIPNQDAKSSCEKEYDRTKNIQDCITRYSN